MGKSACLGSSVGVLSGVGRVEDLCDKSDILLNEVGDLIPFILNDQNSSSSSPPNPPKNAEMIGGLTSRVSTAAVQLSPSTAGPSSSSSSRFGRFRRFFSDTGNVRRE
uniref:Uncharacterized protein n=1 Tax=Romanomermis culicivorax TaxID=13658 RepID=A0A915J7U3_ROMCU